MTTTRAILTSLGALALVVAISAPMLAQDDGEEAMAPMPADVIEGIEWRLVEQAVDGEMAALPEGVVVTLNLADGAAGGSGGCNTYFGSYTLEGDALQLSAIGSTQMFCEGPAGEVETAYFLNLATVASWFSTGGLVVLNDEAGNPVLSFEPASDMPMPTDTIEGITWILLEQATDGELAALPEGVVTTLLMEAGQAGGSGGCNSYFTTYELESTAVSFGEIGSTLMLCEGPGGDVETVYFTNLAQVAAWASDGGRLTLSSADGTTLLVFEPVPQASIVGSWRAIGINNGREAVVSSLVTPEVTADFGADGTLTGNDGCNTYSTTYQVDGGSIAISEAIVTTRMACASDELAEQSAWYSAALVASTSWSIDASGRLELRDDSGALQVSYEADAS